MCFNLSLFDGDQSKGSSSETFLSTRGALLAFGVFAGCLGLAPGLTAAAQASVGSYALPDHFTIDKLGVDIGSMVYERRDTFLTIGDPSNGGLSWTFVGHLSSDPYDGTISYWGPPAGEALEVQVKIGGQLTKFVGCEQSNCQNWSGTGATLVDNGSNWLYTSVDGSIYTFDETGHISDWTQEFEPVVSLGKLLTIKRPTGDLITINYTMSGPDYVIQSVVSSRGYALKYGGSPPNSGSISAINLANHTCDATITTCDGVDSSITFSTLDVVSGGDGLSYHVAQITDTAGGNWQYAVYLVPLYQDPNNPPSDWTPRKDGIHYFKSPDGYEVSLAYDAAGRLTTFIDNRGTWNYTYPDQTLRDAELGGAAGTIQVTDPSSNLFYKGSYGGGIVSYTEDPLGHRTNYNWGMPSFDTGNGFATYVRLNWIQQPESDKRTWSYESARGNVNGVTQTAKNGTDQIGISAFYPTTCTNSFTCNQPTSTTDANIKTTDYTYDSTHGGVRSVMQPAPIAGAARPLKLTTWIQKTPYYKNASGTLVASSTPIWVVDTESVCQTVAGSNSPVCDTAAPKRVTTYEYGANGTANSLWPHGIAVTADGTTHRTCFTYDALGNKISETSPRAGLASCP